MENKGLLTVIAVVLIGILTIMVVQLNEETPAEEISEGLNQAAETLASKVE